MPKKKELSINFDSREVELYPDDLDMLSGLLLNAGFSLIDIIDAELAHILVAKKACDDPVTADVRCPCGAATSTERVSGGLGRDPTRSERNMMGDKKHRHAMLRMGVGALLCLTNLS